MQASCGADSYIASSDRVLNRIEISTGAGLGILHAGLLAGGLIGVGLLMQAGLINAPVAALGLLIILGAMEPFAALRRGAMELGRTILAARRVAPALEAPDNIQSLAAPARGYAVNLEHVTVRHEGVVAKALDTVDLNIFTGERLAIIGTSGAGKSTLFNVLAGEITAEDGNVRVLPARLLTQRTELFKDSLRNNLKLAKSDASDAELNAALEAAGLGRLHGCPDRGNGYGFGRGGDLGSLVVRPDALLWPDCS
jgi:ATP-binding cassette subfamily C protein CydC